MSTAHQNKLTRWTMRARSTAHTLLTAASSITRRQALLLGLGFIGLTALASLSLTGHDLTGTADSVSNGVQPAPSETAALATNKPTDQVQMVAPPMAPSIQPAPSETAALATGNPADQAPADPVMASLTDPSTDVSILFIPLSKPKLERRAALAPATQTLKSQRPPPEAPFSTATATRDRLDELADRFLRFDQALNEAARSRLNTPAEVRRVLKNLRFTNAAEIAQGWYASRAIIAAQHPDFIRGVRDELDIYGESAVTAQLQGSGSYARNISGAQSAAVTVLDTIAADNRKMADLSQRFLTAAREFQNKKWGSLDPLPEPGTAPSKYAASQATIRANAQIGDMLTALATALNELAGITPAHAYAPSTMERILALGARRVIGMTHRSGDTSAALLTDPQSSKCLRWARLNLNQCLAAAHFPSEEAWCTGKHAIEDVRACWAQALPPRVAAASRDTR